jgi:hypothetical protein
VTDRQTKDNHVQLKADYEFKYKKPLIEIPTGRKITLLYQKIAKNKPIFELEIQTNRRNLLTSKQTRRLMTT